MVGLIGPVTHCRTCARKVCYAAGLTKAGLIIATIIIDFAILIASGLLAAAAMTTNNLALSLLALPAIIALFSYSIGGNKVTYEFLKSIIKYASKNRIGNPNFNWEPAKDAISGDGFMVGVALFVVFTLLGSIVVIVSQFGDLEDDSYYALVKIIMIPVILILIMPFIGIGAKIVGNEKAAAECGYNSIRGLFFWKIHSEKVHEQEGSSAEVGTGDSSGGSGDGSFSF